MKITEFYTDEVRDSSVESLLVRAREIVRQPDRIPVGDDGEPSIYVDGFKHFRDVAPIFNPKIDSCHVVNHISDFIARFAASGWFHYPMHMRTSVEEYRSRAEDDELPGVPFDPVRDVHDPYYREKLLAGAAATIAAVGKHFGFKVTVELDHSLKGYAAVENPCKKMDEAVAFNMVLDTLSTQPK